ncbi:MAG: hypothetical protein RLZZ381_2760 [Cyanobacteriota bacterium]|jgi:hypothetical protein
MVWILFLLGLLMIASWGYMIVMQFKSVYKDRTTFGKIVTWFSISTLILYLIGNMSTKISG